MDFVFCREDNEGKTTNGKKITQDMLRKMDDGAYYYPLEQLIKDLKFEDRVQGKTFEDGTSIMIMSKKEIENDITNTVSFVNGLFEGAVKSIKDSWDTIKDPKQLLPL